MDCLRCTPAMPVWASPFSDAAIASAAFRPGRSAAKAVAVMEESWREGRRHAVECDLKSFFHKVNHDKLMTAIREKVREVQDKLNDRPRKYLGWRTPNEILSNHATNVALPS